MRVETRPKPYVSYEEYLRIAPESRIMEWVDGEIIEYMPVTIRHQDVVTFLTRLFGNYADIVNLGKVITAPCEAKLWPGGPAREPDLMFVRTENLHNVDEDRVYGGPDLVVEVISPSSIQHDRVRKFAEYAEAGVGEYWIIDPRIRHKSVEFYILEDKPEDAKFILADVGENGIYTSPILANLPVDTAWLLADKLPNPVKCAADILRTHGGISAEDQAVYEAVYNMYNR